MATVTVADIKQSNGVIRVIDTVMLPKAQDQFIEAVQKDQA